jgi:hypothetical protein
MQNGVAGAGMEFGSSMTFAATKMKPPCPGLDENKDFNLRVGFESVDIVQGEVVYQFMFQDILSWGSYVNPESFSITCTIRDDQTDKIVLKDHFTFLTEQCKEAEIFIMGRVLKLMDEMKEQGLTAEAFKALCAALEALGGCGGGEDGGDVQEYVDKVNELVSGSADSQGQLTARQGVTLLRKFAPHVPFGVLQFADCINRLMIHRDSTQLLVSVFPQEADRENYIHNSTKGRSTYGGGEESPAPRLFVKTKTYPDGLDPTRPLLDPAVAVAAAAAAVVEPEAE